MKPKFFLFFFLILGIVFINGCGISGDAVRDISKFVVYKSPNCNCCEGFISELKRNSFNVEVITTNNIVSIKEKYGVSPDMESCHTSVFTKNNKEYFIEGHVPMKVIEKLLEEQPDVDGIALPGMPKGSLGMPGTKIEKFRIYSIKNGESSLFVEV